MFIKIMTKKKATDGNDEKEEGEVKGISIITHVHVRITNHVAHRYIVKYKSLNAHVTIGGKAL